MEWMAGIVMWSYGLGGRPLPKARFEHFETLEACEAFKVSTERSGYRRVHHDGVEVICLNVARQGGKKA